MTLILSLLRDDPIDTALLVFLVAVSAAGLLIAAIVALRALRDHAAERSSHIKRALRGRRMQPL
jgi:hypothetical protein